MHILHFWQFCGVIGIAFLVLEVFMPNMFFLNFALSAFITALMSIWLKNISVLIFIFVVFSFLSFIFLRPLLIRKFNKSSETGMNSKYIGQVVIANTDITKDNGQINIYGERWDARSAIGEFIPAGTHVKIVRNESIIMYVERVD